MIDACQEEARAIEARTKIASLKEDAHNQVHWLEDELEWLGVKTGSYGKNSDRLTVG